MLCSQGFVYDVNKDFYPNDTGWLGYGTVSKFMYN